MKLGVITCARGRKVDVNSRGGGCNPRDFKPVILILEKPERGSSSPRVGRACADAVGEIAQTVGFGRLQAVC